MSKPTLVLHPNEFNVFHSNYLEPIWQEHFNLQMFDEKITYNKLDSIFVVNCMRSKDWVMPYYNQGYKILVDKLWEFHLKINFPNAYIAEHKQWFHYNTSLWLEFLGYKNYVPQRTYEKLSLMLIRCRKSDRTLLVNRLENRLNNFIYSYVENGIFIDGDIKINENDVKQHYINPDWYDKTCFSLVVETLSANYCPLFITEKTFKPMAFRHPFMIFGQPNVLAELRSWGFETFENLFDESYDSITDIGLRIDALCKNIDSFVIAPFDKFTLEKIEHNYNLFYDKQLILSKIKQEIINPILEYAET